MAFTALIEGDNEGFQFSPIDEDRLQQLVVSLVDTQEELWAGVLQRVDADPRHHRERGCRGKNLPHFKVSDYVLVARVSRQGKYRKLMSTWTGTWRARSNCATSTCRECGFTPMTTSRLSASSSRFSNK